MTATARPATLTVVKIVWTGLFFSQFMYAFVLFTQFAARWPDSSPQIFPDFHETFQMALSSVAVVVVFVAFKLPNFLASKLRAPGTDAVIIDENADPEIEPPLSNELFAAFIVRLALIESICLYGFALAITKHAPKMILPFLALSVILYLKNFPANSKKFRADLGV
jgi:hypothetical protein